MNIYYGILLNMFGHISNVQREVNYMAMSHVKGVTPIRPTFSLVRGQIVAHKEPLHQHPMKIYAGSSPTVTILKYLSNY